MLISGSQLKCRLIFMPTKLFTAQLRRFPLAEHYCKLSIVSWLQEYSRNQRPSSEHFALPAGTSSLSEARFKSLPNSNFMKAKLVFGGRPSGNPDATGEIPFAACRAGRTRERLPHGGWTKSQFGLSTGFPFLPFEYFPAGASSCGLRFFFFKKMTGPS